jgi:hypothetical protein
MYIVGFVQKYFIGKYLIILDLSKGNEGEKISFIINSLKRASYLVRIAIYFMFFYIVMLNFLPIRTAKKIDRLLDRIGPLASARQVIIGLSLMYKLV